MADRKLKPEWHKWIRSEADELAVREGCWFDDRLYEDGGRAIHVVRFFEDNLRHSAGKWAGQPFIPIQWQRDDILMPLFGWVREDGTRRYRLGYIEVAKKNGKSTLGSGIVLYLLTWDGEKGAEVYGAASDRPQAGIVYHEAASMVAQSPALASHCQCIDSRKRIVFPRTGSFYQALSADAFRAEGLKIHGLIFDELHAQPNRRLWDALKYGGAARSQPLLLSITTAGWDRESVCYEQHDYAEAVIDGPSGGGIDDAAYFAYIRGADQADDWKDPAIWAKANPSLGETIAISDMAEACKRASRTAADIDSFKRYRLNIWTTSETHWIDLDRWDECKGAVDPAELMGRSCWAGMDLASTTDMTALVLGFPMDDEEFAILPFFFLPAKPENSRDAANQERYRKWAAMGLLEETPGNVTDYRWIRSRLEELSKQYDIQEIGYDPYNANQFAIQLQDEDGMNMVEVRQGTITMNEPSKQFERLVLKRQLRHGGNPILRWMAGNVTVKPDPKDNIMPGKPRAAAKIDGIIASIIALLRAKVGEDMTSVYEGRGLLVI